MRTNYIAHDNNVDHLQTLPDESVDLIYADPPFNTGHDFNADQGGYSDKTDTETVPKLLSRKFGWLEKVCTSSQLNYFVPMINTLYQCHAVLKPTGALYWHVDDKTSAWYRLILNQIFGQGNYRNEIVWHYTATREFVSRSYKIRSWLNNNDRILFYAKSKEHVVLQEYLPLTLKQRKEYRYTDSHGRKYKNEKDKGSIGNLPSKGKRTYLDENKGTRIGTTWTDIPIASTKERTGYPTQKPRALLKRIIRASSKEGAIVLDPFCGSGTTLSAAQQLNRQWIGIDQNEEAVAITKRRLYPHAYIGVNEITQPILQTDKENPC